MAQTLVTGERWWARLALVILSFVTLGFVISLAVSIGEIPIPLETTAKAVVSAPASGTVRASPTGTYYHEE